MSPDPSRPTVTQVDDPRAMRALAHPLRLRLLAALRSHGPQPVGALARTFGIAAGSASYHLRTLAEHGLVVEAPELAHDARERWWRAGAELTSWEPADVLGDPERWAALDVLRRTVLRGYVEQLEAALTAEADLPREWVAASFQGDDRLDLTVQELAELRADLEALFERWHARSDAARPDARSVLIIGHAFRQPDPTNQAPMPPPNPDAPQAHHDTTPAQQTDGAR
ncbi:helix-turn-helix domain-containing protein [Pengzhenrongella frigida]|uniref:MarR family transcriptional regulator n=1 Tax=Pengzhenrongella frigida TaxID=1259133 RepID=A0A4Q5N3K3_9MICO|nr:helix-turn-helix domain-containing protein [Cellulomonas sp. HLT2-17]RYV51207.1 MarR family transcriptional regulator [Cellulomonas sp. HLT2-17]